ncbi:hypothetical protein QNH20_18370 [Neobacillus sp. WH10]|uniref:hypothetical protein n=1 Tax=Neobacillus sp. WH10 TaxID=3047873 RepID=UPI0024C183B9|nr:hypothetical protein [Neobacillus sp. WH10]WHY76078.1 hypothetical protein QNH20_18370 [Neobacillus sp. WH10]
MRKTYYVDDEENVYTFHGHLENGLYNLFNIMTEEYYHADPHEVKRVESTQLVKGLLQKFKDISYGFHTEISSRNNTEMTEKELAHMKGLLLGSHIIHSRKIKL